jgi:hypothetical protein
MRTLTPIDAEHSAIPFNYDGQILGSLREDQVPRFFGALTDTQSLPVMPFNVSALTAMQNRVSTGKVDAIRASADRSGKKPLVVINNGKSYIADGHHRATAHWLDGADTLEAHYKDISPVSNVVKGDEIRLFKTDDEMRMVFGFASVIENPAGTVVDTQNDTIDSSELLKSVTTYMEGARIAKEMHVGGKIGEVIHSFPLTPELAKSLGISTPQYGWIVGMKVHDESTWQRVKKGELASFSIGGSATRVPT